MPEIAPLTAEELKVKRKNHQLEIRGEGEAATHCWECGDDWPCPTARLLVTIDARDKQIEGQKKTLHKLNVKWGKAKRRYEKAEEEEACQENALCSLRGAVSDAVGEIKALEWLVNDWGCELLNAAVELHAAKNHGGSLAECDNVISCKRYRAALALTVADAPEVE